MFLFVTISMQSKAEQRTVVYTLHALPKQNAINNKQFYAANCFLFEIVYTIIVYACKCSQSRSSRTFFSTYK